MNPLFPARNYLPVHHVHRNYLNNSLVGGRGLIPATERVTLYCTLHPSATWAGPDYVNNIKNNKITLT